MAIFFKAWRRRRNATRKFLKLHIPMGKFADEDVFIAGFPRSGNTWFQDLITMTIYGVRPELSPPLLAQTLVPDMHSRTFYQRYSAPMFFKTHHQPRPEFRRVVYLLRDGRDSMVSNFHYGRVFHPELDFLDMVTRGTELHHGKWHEHVEAWLANPFQAELLVIKFEDLKRDTAGELQRFCDFAGVERDCSLLENVARETVFAKMQRREIIHGEGDPEWPKGHLFRRRGIVGSYQDEMPPEILAAFMSEAEPTLRKCGYLDDACLASEPFHEHPQFSPVPLLEQISRKPAMARH